MTSPQARAHYSAGAQLIHWLTAAAVLVTFIISSGGPESRVYSPDRAGQLLAHESLGVAVFVLAILSLAWRLVDRPPASPPMMAWMRTSSRVVQAVLSDSPRRDARLRRLGRVAERTSADAGGDRSRRSLFSGRPWARPNSRGGSFLARRCFDLVGGPACGRGLAPPLRPEGPCPGCDAAGASAGAVSVASTRFGRRTKARTSPGKQLWRGATPLGGTRSELRCRHAWIDDRLDCLRPAS